MKALVFFLPLLAVSCDAPERTIPTDPKAYIFDRCLNVGGSVSQCIDAANKIYPKVGEYPVTVYSYASQPVTDTQPTSDCSKPGQRCKTR